MRPSPGQQHAVQQQHTLWSQFAAWHSTLPLWTGAVFTLCCPLSVLSFVLGIRASSVCLSSFYILYGAQLWRLLTAPFFHAGLMHVALNMMAWTQLGPSMERLVGTVQFAWLCLLFASLGGLLHSLAGFGRSRECAVGLSGVIFSLVVVDSHLTPTATRLLFGIVNVSTRWYPLALLAFLQLLLPNASVLGHLAGVLVGYAYCWGGLNWAVLSSTAVNTLERARCVAGIVARPNFILSAGLPDPHGGGLPRWITAPGGDGFGLRMPGWLHRTMAQAQAAAGVPPNANVGGGTSAAMAFGGRGRTLGRPEHTGAVDTAAALNASSLQSQQLPAPSSASTSSSAAEARARAARAAEARLMQRNVPEPSSASAVASAAAGVLPTGHVRLEATPPGLSQLVAMGFDQDEAREALLQSGGDLNDAIERLS